MSEINEAIERIRNNPNSGATCAVRDKDRILSHWLAVGKPSRWLSRVRKYRNVAVQLFQGTKGKAREWRRPKYRRNRCSPIVCMNVNGSSIFPLLLASSLTFSLRCFLPAGSRFHHSSSPPLLLSPNTYLGTSFTSCLRFSSVLLPNFNGKFKKSKLLLLFRYFQRFDILQIVRKKTDLVSWNNYLWSIFVCWIRITVDKR